MDTTGPEARGIAQASAASLATPLQWRTASHLNVQHGRGAMTEAVRQGMRARKRGDEAATAFWCAVCSLLVQMRQEAGIHNA